VGVVVGLELGVGVGAVVPDDFVEGVLEEVAGVGVVDVADPEDVDVAGGVM